MRKDPPFDANTWRAPGFWSSRKKTARRCSTTRALSATTARSSRSRNTRNSPADAGDAASGQLQQFIDANGDVVLKPLDGMGGESVFASPRAIPTAT